MTSLLNIGISSLYASKYALTVTGQNIANSNNPTYSRRLVEFTQQSGGFGGGVTIAGLRRVFDEVANQNVLYSRSNNAFSESCVEQLTALESVLNDDSSGIGSSLKQSLTQLNQLNANAASTQSRRMYTQELSNMAARFSWASNQLIRTQQDLNQNQQITVEAVNGITQKLANINGKLMVSSGTMVDDDRMQLMDQRDGLLVSLADYINFDSSMMANGAVNIEVGNGTPLVIGNTALAITTTPSNLYPNVLEMGVVNGATTIPITSGISGGSLGALMVFQQQTLKTATQSLDRLALVLANSLNAQNNLGVDAKGQLGGNLFSDVNDPTMVSRRVLAQTTNQGSGVISPTITNAEQLKLTDYTLVFTSATDYQLFRNSDESLVSSGTLTSPTSNIGVDGFNVAISSPNFSPGDVFLISPLSNGASNLQLESTDGNALALASPVRVSASTTNSGTGMIALDAVLDTTTTDFSVPNTLTPSYQIEFNDPPTSYQLINLTTNTVAESNIPYNPNSVNSVFPTPLGQLDPGYRVNLSGAMKPGDAFVIDYNATPGSDNRNGMAMADLYQRGVLENGGLSFLQAFNMMNTQVSQDANVASIALETNHIIKSQAEQRRDSVSGVSLEEEAMNLALYQQTYEASAQILDVARDVFSVLLGIMRR